jgi:hypothetical protein
VLRRDRDAEPGSTAPWREVLPLVPVAGPRAGAAGLPQAVQQAAVAAGRFSAAARAPFPVPGPEAAQLVPPEPSARQAQGLPLAARHEAQPGAAEAEPTDAGAAAEGVAEAEPDVGVAAVSPVVPAGLPSGPPWAAVWVFRQDRVLPWPVRRRSAPTARAMELSPVAWPSERSWQAALVVVLSCALGPGEFGRE